ncbi:hypothetical protein SAMN05216390_13416 [Lachnospiraceae bacterium KH1T2]|nr:hypothetical protein SAMN05216390_13416 [Lachnospiraceae bacterium KH1T2]
MSTYIWCEDSGSGFLFWKKLFNVLYEEFTVETKKNNSELFKAALKVDSENEYYIIMDYFIDNPNVLRETKRLSDIIKDKKNVHTIKIPSFEFIILSFTLLEKWIFTEEDELRDKRKEHLQLKDLLVDSLMNENYELNEGKISELREKLNYSDSLYLEQLLAKLLYEITRNTGFETSKGKLGECFTVDCCTWESKQSDDLCGLEYNHLSYVEKMRLIADNSVIKDSFVKAGL